MLPSSSDLTPLHFCLSLEIHSEPVFTQLWAKFGVEFSADQVAAWETVRRNNRELPLQTNGVRDLLGIGKRKRAKCMRTRQVTATPQYKRVFKMDVCSADQCLSWRGEWGLTLSSIAMMGFGLVMIVFRENRPDIRLRSASLDQDDLN